MEQSYRLQQKNRFQVQNQMSKRVPKKSSSYFQNFNPQNQNSYNQNSQNNFQLQDKYMIMDDTGNQQAEVQSQRNSQKKQTNVEYLRSKLIQLQVNLSKKSQKESKSTFSNPAIVELQICLKLLQNQFPNFDLEKIIPKIHKLLDHNCTSTKVSKNDENQNGYSSGKQNGYSSGKQTKIAFQPNMESQTGRNFQQKIVAESFINHGYGIKVLRDIVKNYSIKSPKYNNIITTIMRNTFRALESTIKKIRKNVVPVGPNQERLLRAPLIDCQKWLPPDQLQTFHNFIKGIWGISETNISTDNAMKLYNSIMKQLQQRELEGKSYKLSNNNQQHPNNRILGKRKVNDR